MKKTWAFDLTVGQQEQLHLGARLLREGDPLAAHECFERVFRSSNGEIQGLFRALAQLSAAYHQLQLGRARAARNTLAKALRRLQLVDSLSLEFQKSVERLFDARGAREGCARFVEVDACGPSAWPLPERVAQVARSVGEHSGGSMADGQSGAAGAGFNGVLGLNLLSVEAKQVVAELRVETRHHQPWGIVHGGVYCAMVETVCSIGGQVAAGDAGFVVGVDNHTSFLKATRVGLLRVTARPLAQSKRTQLWEANIVDAHGDLVATGRVRLMLVEKGRMLAGEPAAQKPGVA